MAIVAIPVAVGGCGSSSSTSSNAAKASTAAANAPVPGPGGSVKVSETEYKLTPTNTTVQHGPVKIDVSNNGQIPHSLNIDGPHGDITLGKTLSAGQSGSFTANLPAGTYTWYCPISNHRMLGMQGQITVK